MNKITSIAILCIVVGFTACTSDNVEKNEEGKFTITSALYVDTCFTKDYVAQIQSIQNVEIHAMVKGYIETINVDEGQQVKIGQILFKIMPKEYEAEMLKAKAEAKTAELEMLNTKTLADKNIVSQTELALAQAKFDEAKAELARTELFFSFTEIKAPFDGVIDRIRFKVGSLIDEGTLLTTISNNKEIYAYFNVSEVEYLDYKARNNNTKDSATLLLANFQPHKYKGYVETIEGEFDNETGNIAFRAKFPNPDFLLKHGETGKIQLTIPLKKAVIIPQKATFDVLDKKFVYVVDKNNIVTSRQIIVAQEMPHLYVVASGLSPNDKILAEGLGKVKNNEKIESEFIPFEKMLSELNNLHAE